MRFEIIVFAFVILVVVAVMVWNFKSARRGDDTEIMSGRRRREDKP